MAYREQRPHVAAVGNRLQLIELEVLLDARGRGVNDRRRAADRHGFLQRGERELHIHIGSEAQRNLDAFASAC